MPETERRIRPRPRPGRVEGTLVVVAMVAIAAMLLPLGSVIAGASLRLQSVHGNLDPVPPGATAIGPAPAAASLLLVVTLQPRDPAALASAAQAVSDPRSPQYRKFLTPARFARLFGPTPSTIHSVTAAFQQEGLTVGPPSATGLSLPVSGTTAQIESAFATPITAYRLASGNTGYHNDAPPEVPASVAPQIEGVLGLDTLTPPQPTDTVPQTVHGPAAPGSAPSGPAVAPGQPSAQRGSCATAANPEREGGTLDAVQPALESSFRSLDSASEGGAGTTVALVEMSGGGYSSSDISTFASCRGITLANGQIAEKQMGGGAAAGGTSIEAELDIETILTLAPSANIEVYEAGPTNSLYDVVSQIVSDDTASIVSASWTNGCEAYVGASLQDSENTLFQAAALDGLSVFVASSDTGSTGCNLDGQIAAPTGAKPVAQAIGPATGRSSNANQPASQLSAGLRTVSVAVSGSQTDGGAPTSGGSDSPPAGVDVDTGGLSCTTVGTSTPISATLSAGSYTLEPASCSGATLSGAAAADYGVAYTGAASDFTVGPAPLVITASSGAITYGGTVPTVTPAYSGFKNGDTASSLSTAPTCSTIATPTSPVSGSPYVTSCGGAIDANYAITYAGGFVTVSPAPLTVTASSGAMTYGGTVPTITPGYAGFKNGDTASILTAAPTCSTTATSASPVSGSPYASSCSGGADSNYSYRYIDGSVTVGPAPVSVAVSMARTRLAGWIVAATGF